MRAKPKSYYDLDWPPGPGMLGSAHSICNEPIEEDAAEKVRKVAEEVTGKTMPRPAPRKIGFY